MHLCPSCKKPGIGPLAKRWSSRGSPAKCAMCGQFSHVIASTSSGIVALSVLGLVVALSLAAIFQSVLLALSGICVVAACNIWAWRRAEMFVIYPEQAKAAANENWVVAALAVLWAFFG